MNIIGDVAGKHCLVVDDLVDTAGTLVKGVEALVEAGAKSVSACASHAVLSGPALERIMQSPLTELVVTDSIPCSPEAINTGKVKVMSIAPLLARGIRSIHEGGSISTLFM
jgi:ribose-phosphate pyrophosphokinase